MIKTGWVMEWENEVRFRAPMRAHLNTMVKVMTPFSEAMKNATMSFTTAAKTLAEMVEAFKQPHR